MNRSMLAVAAACSCLALQALADSPRHRHYRHYPPHSGWSLYFSAPISPWWGYPAPAYAWAYPPPYEPVIVERVYEVPVYREPARVYRDPPRAEVRPAPKSPKLAAVPPPRLERYSLSARELFDFDQAALRSPQPKLDEIARVLKENPQFDRVTIEGHTDRLGSEEYNLGLSDRRANAVKDYLVARGVEPRRLVAIGKGEAEPVVHCRDAPKAELVKCLEPNRRVEVQQITVERRVPAG